MDNADLSKLSEKKRVYIERLSEGEGWRISETLRRLLRVFYGVLILILILTATGINEFIKSENGSFYTYLFVYFFACFFYIMARQAGGQAILLQVNTMTLWCRKYPAE